MLVFTHGGCDASVHMEGVMLVFTHGGCDASVQLTIILDGNHINNATENAIVDAYSQTISCAGSQSWEQGS